MAKKRETKSTESIIPHLQTIGWFRKISDRVQVGFPDIIGIYRGIGCGLEVKAISEVPADQMVPPKGEHPFSPTQKRELCNIRDNGGLAFGVIVCGKVLLMVEPHHIDDDGRVHWEKGFIIERKSGAWNFKNFFNVFIEKHCMGVTDYA